MASALYDRVSSYRLVHTVKYLRVLAPGLSYLLCGGTIVRNQLAAFFRRPRLRHMAPLIAVKMS